MVKIKIVSETELYKINLLDYPVYLGCDLWTVINDFLLYKNDVEVFVVTDQNTKMNCLPVLLDHVPAIADRPVFSFQPGEEAKNLDTLKEIWLWLMSSGATKKALLLNLGGGVVSDLGGLAAATFKRGIGYVNIPTSLIGQVDAAIGGKTGINISGVKNQAGVFYNPKAVFVNPDFLNTLPNDHVRSGMAEMVKSAALSVNDMWDKVGQLSKNEKVPFDLIHDAITFKCQVVLEDPLDLSTRKMLNFGHTIGHALESLHSQDRPDYFSHGKAIAAGMICEAFISHEIAGLPDDEVKELSGVLTGIFDFKPLKKEHYKDCWEMMTYDKKNTGDGIAFSLLEKIGKPILEIEVDRELIYRSFEYFNKIVQQ